MAEGNQQDHGSDPASTRSDDLDRENGPALTSSGRTIQACDRCRLKKVRCDGVVPTCGRCKAANLGCFVTVKLTRKSYPKSYTESIEERLREVEAEGRAKDDRIKELESALAAAATMQQTTPWNPSLLPNSAQPPSNPLTGFGVRPKSGSRVALTDEPISREVGRMNADRRGVGRFMGSSSGIFFIGTAEQRFAAIVKSPGKVEDELLRVDADEENTSYSLHAICDNTTPSASLPPMETALNFVHRWFDCWCYVFPILHQPSFMKSLETLYATPAETHDRPFLAQFYLVLALGCRHLLLTKDMSSGGLSTASIDREDLQYYHNSLRYRNEILNANNLQTLQFQELLTLWFSYTGKKSLAFQMTGSMVKLSLELGLHRHSRRFTFDPLTTELRKRAFWVCYIMDNFLSAVEGLPKSFRDQDIDVELPSDVDDEFVTANGYLLSLPGEPTGMTAFVSLVKVVRVLSNTLEMLYTTTDRRRCVTKIASINRQLDQWVHTLPDHLQIYHPATATEPEDVFEGLGSLEPAVLFLHMTYFYVCIAVHRVALSFPPSVPQYKVSLVQCMKAAKELIYLASRFRAYLLVFEINPGGYVYTLWSCGLLLAFGLWGVQKDGGSPSHVQDAEKDAKSLAMECVEVLRYLAACGCTSARARADNLGGIIASADPMFSTSDDGRLVSGGSTGGASIPDGTAVRVNTTQSTSSATPSSQPCHQLPDAPSPFTSTLQELSTSLVASYDSQIHPSQSPADIHGGVPAQTPVGPSSSTVMEGFNGDFSLLLPSSFDRFDNFTYGPPPTDVVGLQSIGGLWDDPIFQLPSDTVILSPTFAAFQTSDVTSSVGSVALNGERLRKRQRLNTGSNR